GAVRAGGDALVLRGSLRSCCGMRAGGGGLHLPLAGRSRRRRGWGSFSPGSTMTRGPRVSPRPPPAASRRPPRKGEVKAPALFFADKRERAPEGMVDLKIRGLSCLGRGVRVGVTRGARWGGGR